MKFIKLTIKDGTQVIIRKKEIVTIEDRGQGSVIFLKGGESTYALESVSAIWWEINK